MVMVFENYCRNCGHRVLPNEPFCVKCGVKTGHHKSDDLIVFTPPIHNIGFFNFPIDLKEFFLHQLEQLNNDTDAFSNKGLIDVLNDSSFNDVIKSLVVKYKNNFLFIQKKIDYLLQSLIDKISTIPYTVRCICKIIYLLI